MHFEPLSKSNDASFITPHWLVISPISPLVNHWYSGSSHWCEDMTIVYIIFMSKIRLISIHHNISQYITRYHSISLYITIHHNISQYISRFTRYHYISLYITLYHYISLYITIDHSISPYISLYHYVYIPVWWKTDWITIGDLETTIWKLRFGNYGWETNNLCFSNCVSPIWKLWFRNYKSPIWKPNLRDWRISDLVTMFWELRFPDLATTIHRFGNYNSQMLGN